MIQTSQIVMEALASYASPKAKLTRMVASGELVRIKRGLYVSDPATPRKALAPMIYGPSYISFQTALARYGLIPERVESVLSASYGKNRDKHYRTPLGEYRYLYVPTAAYPYGLDLAEEGGFQYIIASREKALCDSVYKAGKTETGEDIRELLLDNWRMDEDDLRSLDLELVRFLAPRYGRRSVTTLALWMEKEFHG